MADVPPSPILFRGIPAVPPPEVFEEARNNQPLWFRLLEDAASQFARMPENAGIYADPYSGNGATVEQVWLFFTMLGIRPYCLLAHRLPEDQTARIERLRLMKAPEIVNALKKLQTGDLGAPTTMIYDGQTGHCVNLLSYEPSRDRFVYYDPWPLKSMLSQDNNVLAIDALNEGSKNHWSVSSEELESVLFAVMLSPVSWARLEGIELDQMFDTWSQSGFFRFFHLKKATHAVAEGINKVEFTVGPFTKEILLDVSHKPTGEIVAASLFVDTAWMIENWVITLDLIASFVQAFAPPPDAEDFRQLAKSIRTLSDPNSLTALENSTTNESVLTDCVRSLVGLSGETATMFTDFASLSIALTNQDGKSAVTLQFELQ